jgi:hypothetical protein
MSFRTMLAYALGSSALAGDGFEKLFNGKNLHGWEGDSKWWTVSGGVLSGSSRGESLPGGALLAAARPYADFILKARVLAVSHEAGIVFRAALLPGAIAAGYEAAMAAGRWGAVSDAASGSVLSGRLAGSPDPVVKPGEWNDYEIRCQGPRIQIFLNGRLAAALPDAPLRGGFLALRLGSGAPAEARFRDIKIQVLDPSN